MTPELWAEIEKLYGELADLPRAGQRQALSAISDETLRREVASLLSASPRTEIGAAIREAIFDTSLAAAQPALQRFGPWQTTGVIGHGGMGAVYTAVRADHAFDKQVAIKVLHLGLDSPSARERFRQERGILAGLEHPNIAHLLDGGETESGLSYIVLEYVDGQNIVEFCQARKLTRDERLRLFLSVCGAVQYAHQNLVVHRDLKPANILVNAAGAPKLLDFGIAKLMEPDALQTMTGFQALTPQYASPEQIRGEPVTTATDVYSLGMVLYETLTGRRPYKVDPTSVADIARAVCEVPPAPAGLGGDLDNILSMALRKEAPRRYAAVQDFAGDIERLLSHRPVRARADSLRYRASKFLRRNRVAVAGAVLLIGALSGALALTLRAERRERARFDQVRQLATKFLFEFDRDIRQLPGATAAREKLVTTAMQQLDSLSADSSDDPQLTADLAQAYASVGDVVGMPGLPSLGHMDRAEQSYRKACALASGLLARDASASSPYRALACSVHTRLGFLLTRMHRSGEGRSLMLQGLGYIAPKLASGSAGAVDYRVAANGHVYLSALDLRASRTRSSAQDAAQAVALMRKFQALSPGIRANSDLARVLLQAGNAAVSAGDLEVGLRQVQEVVSFREGIGRTNPNDMENRREIEFGEAMMARIQFTPGGVSLGRDAEALTRISQAGAILRDLANADPRNISARDDLALNLIQLAALQSQDNPRGAEEALHESARIFGSLPQTFAGRDRHAGLAWSGLSSLLRQNHRLPEARAALAEAENMYARDNPSDELARGDFLTLWTEQAEFALQTRQPTLAIAAWTRMWKELEPTAPAAREDILVAFQLAGCSAGLARAYELAGDAPAAAGWKLKSANAWQTWKGRYPNVDRQLEKYFKM